MENKITEVNIIFEKVNKKYSDQKGKIVVIEPESGNYFIDEDEIEAYRKAKKMHPNKKFFIKRIGFDTYYFVGSHGGIN